MNNQEIFYAFVESINRHDIDALSRLMSDNHIFIDAHADIFVGREKMQDAWKQYFSLFPDYEIDIESITDGEEFIAAFGVARGSLNGSGAKEDTWTLPAAWRAIIEDDKVRLWQVYADTKIPYDILERHQ